MNRHHREQEVHRLMYSSRSPNQVVGPEVVQAMARDNNLQVGDLDIYLLKNRRFKSFIYDRREVRCIANSSGLAPDCVVPNLES